MSGLPSEAETTRKPCRSISASHVSSILTKLGLNNRVQIALLVHDAGLLDEQAPEDGAG